MTAVLRDPAQRPRALKNVPPAPINMPVTGTSFRFRLERVRAVRERKEKLAQQELARSITRLSSSQADLDSAEAQLRSAQDEQRSSAQSTLGAVELQSRQAFIERVEARRSRKELDLEHSEAEVASRNAALVRAAGEHEMLNRLRERRRLEHQRETALSETKVLDEMAASRTQRRTA